MQDIHEIQDPFHRALYRLISEKIDERMAQMAAGNAADYEEYRQQVGYLQAFADVLGFCDEIEKERYGDPLGKKEDE